MKFAARRADLGLKYRTANAQDARRLTSRALRDCRTPRFAATERERRWARSLPPETLADALAAVSAIWRPPERRKRERVADGRSSPRPGRKRQKRPEHGRTRSLSPLSPTLTGLRAPINRFDEWHLLPRFPTRRPSQLNRRLVVAFQACASRQQRSQLGRSRRPLKQATRH